MIKLIRSVLGRIIIYLDFLTRSNPVKRNLVSQEKINSVTAKFSLYQFNACPFCVKVRRHLHHKAINIQLRDAKNNEGHKKALIEGGGKHKVPCLRIESENSKAVWLYESDAIIAYLDEQLRAF